MKTFDGKRNDAAINSSSKYLLINIYSNVYIDNLIESKKEIVELRTKVDSLINENAYLNAKIENDMNEINKLKQENEELIKHIESFEKDVN